MGLMIVIFLLVIFAIIAGYIFWDIQVNTDQILEIKQSSNKYEVLIVNKPGRYYLFVFTKTSGLGYRIKHNELREGSTFRKSALHANFKTFIDVTKGYQNR